MDSQTKPAPGGNKIDPSLCPNCHSADIRSSRSVYDTAKNYSRSSISRVAVTGGAGFYLDGANVRPTPETLLAAKFPPPEKPKFSWWLSSLTLLCAAFLFFCLTQLLGISTWPALAICVISLAADHFIRQFILRKKLALYHRKYAEWEKMRICLDCKSSFYSA
jgi:hypothetical protein